MASHLERALQRVFQRDPESFRDQDGPDTVEGWDSHAHLELLSELEEAYQIEFSVDEQLELATLGDVKAALRKRGLAP